MDERCHGSTMAPDWKDVAMALQAMEGELDGTVTVQISRGGNGKFAFLRMEAHLYRCPPGATGLVHLASAKMCTSGNGVKGTSAALLLLLHDLDCDYFRRTVQICPYDGA